MVIIQGKDNQFWQEYITKYGMKEPVGRDKWIKRKNTNEVDISNTSKLGVLCNTN